MDGGVLVVGGGASTPSEHCPGPLEQGTQPTTAHLGPCWGLILGGDLPSPIVEPPREPGGDKVVKKRRRAVSHTLLIPVILAVGRQERLSLAPPPPGDSRWLQGVTSRTNSICLLRDIVNGLSAKDISVRIFEDFASAWPWILL